MSDPAFDDLADVMVRHRCPVPRTREAALVGMDALLDAGVPKKYSDKLRWLAQPIDELALREVKERIRKHDLRRLAKLVTQFMRYQRGWWRTRQGEWLKLSEMEDGHVLNAARMIMFGPRRQTKYGPVVHVQARKWVARMPALVREVVRRGLLLYVAPGGLPELPSADAKEFIRLARTRPAPTQRPTEGAKVSR